MTFPYKLIDLTHIISPHNPTWNGDCGFQHKIRQNYADTTIGTQFLVQDIEMQAGIGTHIDAPAHCIEGGKTIPEILLEELASPLFVIDISDRAHETYSLTVQDILDFEIKFGSIEPNTFVIVRTGWDLFWHDSLKYRNNLIYPSISVDAGALLLERGVKGIGIDTLSPDSPEGQYPIHQLFLGAGKYIVENVANSKEMPPVGGYIMILPIKTFGGTEAPIRLVGLITIDDTAAHRMNVILDLGNDISIKEKELSIRMLDLLKQKKVIAVRLLFESKKELFIEFEDGTRLFVDNFNDQYDISIT